MRIPASIVVAVLCVALAACGNGQRTQVRQTSTPQATTSASPASTTVMPVRLADGPHRIAFISDRDGASRVYTMALDGTDVRRLSDQVVDESAPMSVSNDGTQIVVSGPSVENGKERTTPPPLYRIDVEGGATVKIGQAPASDSVLMIPAPNWHADDAAIDASNYQVCYVFSADGGDAEEQDSGICLAERIQATAPNGHVAIVIGDQLIVGDPNEPSSGRAIDTVLPDIGTAAPEAGIGVLSLLAQQTFGFWRPLWSPDSTHIAYLDDDAGGKAGLSVIGADGDSPKLVVPADDDLLVPGAWTDDSATLLFSGLEKGSTIRAVNVKSGAIRQLLGGDGHSYWSPRLVVDAPAPARTSAPSVAVTQTADLNAQLAREPGRLVYEGGDSRDRQGFYTSKPDGSDERLLTEQSGYPSFTSGDEHLLYFATRTSPGDVVIDVLTGTQRNMTTANLSADGKQIAYWDRAADNPTPVPTHYPALPLELPVVLTVEDVATGVRHKVFTDGGDADVEPAWSPDGKQLAFFRVSPPSRPDTNGDWALMVMSADGGTPRQVATLTSELDASGPIAWSPDGTKIAFDDDQLRVAAADGSGTRDYQVPADAVTWSPDGKTLILRGDGIYSVDASTGAARELTQDVAGAVEYPPAWSPDGQWIAYVGSDGTLRVMNIATGGIVRLPQTGDQVAWVRP